MPPTPLATIPRCSPQTCAQRQAVTLPTVDSAPCRMSSSLDAVPLPCPTQPSPLPVERPEDTQPSLTTASGCATPRTTPKMPRSTDIFPTSLKTRLFRGNSGPSAAVPLAEARGQRPITLSSSRPPSCATTLKQLMSSLSSQRLALTVRRSP